MKITRETFLKAKAGDIAARNEIIEANMGLVVLCAERVTKNITRNRVTTVDDRIQDGAAYLPWIIQHFDPDRGVRFSTYAMRCLRREMLDCQFEDSVVRVPRQTQVTDETWKQKERMRGVQSLGGVRRASRVRGTNLPSEHEETARLIETVKGRLQTLSPRERDAIRHRMNGVLLRDVGAIMGVSHQAVHQYETRAILKIQSAVKVAA